MRYLYLLALTFCAIQATSAREYHVSLKGSDANDGSFISPCRTISHAARMAMPGDVITVHEGIYRERVTPPRGGDSDTKRIVYQVAPGEMAGIKLHGAIDVEISRNHIYRTCRGLWLDWMAQGTRVTGNLFHDNGTEKDMTVEIISGGEQDMFVEVNHGPFLVDNNTFLSAYSVNNRSQGGAYVHNLFAGTMRIVPFDERLTPYHPAHTTEVAGLHNNPSGDNRYYNNIFVELPDMSQYDSVQWPVWMDGNVYIKGARPSVRETGPVTIPGFDPGLKLTDQAGGFYLEINLDKIRSALRTRKTVTTELLVILLVMGSLPTLGQTRMIAWNPDTRMLACTGKEGNPWLVDGAAQIWLTGGPVVSTSDKRFRISAAEFHDRWVLTGDDTEKAIDWARAGQRTGQQIALNLDEIAARSRSWDQIPEESPAVWLLWDFWSERLTRVAGPVQTIPVPSKSCLVYSLRSDLGRPQLLGTSGHFSQGTLEVQNFKWDARSESLTGRVKGNGGDPATLFFHVPEGMVCISAAVGYNPIMPKTREPGVLAVEVPNTD